MVGVQSWKRPFDSKSRLLFMSRRRIEGVRDVVTQEFLPCAGYRRIHQYKIGARIIVELSEGVSI